MNRRDFNRIATTLLGAAPLIPLRAAERYPAKPISLVVAYSAGGSADLRARQVGRYMSTALAQPVVVENRPGGAGNIGTQYVARARPDGYALGIGNLGPLSVNPALFANLSFDPAKDLTMIALIERGPLLLLVRPDSPYKTVADLIRSAKASPTGLTYGSSGAGGAHHLSGELLKSLTGSNLVHIPYKGGTGAMVDLLGGRLDFLFEPMYSALPATRMGKVRSLAVTSKGRSALLPGVPTMDEAGVPGFQVENWQGLVGPAGLPTPIIQTLNKTVNQALQDHEIRALLLSQGNEPGGGTPEAFAAYVKAERSRWQQLIRASGIEPS